MKISLHELSQAKRVLRLDIDPDTGDSRHPAVLRFLGILAVVAKHAEYKGHDVVAPFKGTPDLEVEDMLIIESQQSVAALNHYGDAYDQGQALGHVKRRAESSTS